MPYLNLQYSLLVYEDISDRQPLVKITDVTKAVQKVPVNEDTSSRVVLGPGETQDIVLTSRAVSWDSSTVLAFNRYLAAGNNIRITWTGTGTAPAFRTNRAIGGDASTVVSITRITPYVVRITNTAGTAWSLGAVANGDNIKFEKNTDTFTSPFSAQNLGTTWVVQAKGSNYIDFIDNGLAALDTNITLGASFEFALRVFSNGPVKISDTIVISGAGINASNQGRFNIVDLSYDYVEVCNPFGEPETDTYGSNVLNIYEYLIGFMHLRASGLIQIRYDAQTDWATLDRIGQEVLQIGSVSAYRVTVMNPDPANEVILSVQTAQALKGCC